MTVSTDLCIRHYALIGTPNSGKTALFNALTGSRQKVANYPGVTVERKSGLFSTPAGHAINVIDLPGTYSLRARSPDEEVTRDFVLGRLHSETPPDLLLCVADATNLRLAMRLVIELKRLGKPLLLVLNMIDIANRRGIAIDVAGLSRELGIPVTTAAAVRRGGIDDLLRRLDDLAADAPASHGGYTWKPPSTSELRAAQREADRIIGAAVGKPPAPDTLTARLDAVLLHPVGGLIVLFVIMFTMFQAVFTWAQPPMQLLSGVFDTLGGKVHTALPPGMLQSFVENGIISGVGSVVVFLPQILILFLFILLLEDFGYMARAAFLMDRIMGNVGLHGRAFIPLLSSFACAIPGIMATRVIDSRRDRLTTILVAPLMTCSARIPVYTLIISAFIPARTVWGFANLQGLVMFGLFAAGIFTALCVSAAAKFFLWREHPTPPFMLELPDYKLPRMRSIAIGLYARAKMFLHRARHDHFCHDGPDLVPGFLPPTASWRGRACNRLQPGSVVWTSLAAGACSDRFQLADQRRPDSGNGCARGRRGVARDGLCYRRRQGGRFADRPSPRAALELGNGAFGSCLVYLCAAMRIDAGRNPARNGQLAIYGADLRLYAGPCLSWLPYHV